MKPLEIIALLSALLFLIVVGVIIFTEFSLLYKIAFVSFMTYGLCVEDKV